jgi:hypothetical protein
MLEVIASAKPLAVGAIIDAGRTAKLLIVAPATREDLLAWRAHVGSDGVAFYQRGRGVSFAPEFPPADICYYYRVLDL